MRKAISTVAVVCAFLASASGVALAAHSHVSTKRCGGKYTPTCTIPHITNTPPSPKCSDVGHKVKLPNMTFTSNSGIKSITVKEGGRTIKNVSFKGQGPTQYSIKGLMVSSTGLKAGGHLVSVKITDVRGRSASKTLRFSICVSTPVFTG